jgi:hypothetical protein
MSWPLNTRALSCHDRTYASHMISRTCGFETDREKARDIILISLYEPYATHSNHYALRLPAGRLMDGGAARPFEE